MMRELTYILMDPTGNRTLLITDPISEADRPAAAAELMKLEPSAEQAGFLDKSGICDIAKAPSVPGFTQINSSAH